MPAPAIIISISITIISIILGIILFYFMSDLPVKKRKKLSEDVSSQIVNFFLFIWLAKILLNLPVFLGDPFAILAYPSGANAFYLAVFFSASLIFFQMKKGRIEGLAFVQALTHITIQASFFYEFMQLTWNNGSDAFGNLILYAALWVLFLILNGRATAYATISAVLAIWASGMLLILTFQPYALMFGYLMELWFIFLVFVTGQLLILLYSRKRRANEHN